MDERRHRSRGAFGDDAFGRFAEQTARFFGTPQYILAQTVVVILWIVFNGFEILVHYDRYPFILLNLLFSTQAAYAAPLILLAQTRQADRDKHHTDLIDRAHTKLEESAVARTEKLEQLLEANTTLTQQDKELTQQVHALAQEIRELLGGRQPS